MLLSGVLVNVELTGLGFFSIQEVSELIKSAAFGDIWWVESASRLAHVLSQWAESMCQFDSHLLRMITES